MPEFCRTRIASLALSFLLPAALLTACCHVPAENPIPAGPARGSATVTSVRGSAEYSVPTQSPTPSNPAQTSSANSENWQPLFDGKSLGAWKSSDFGGAGEVEVKNGELLIHMGALLSGITWTNEAALPKTNYEISIEAKKVDGTDFFCGLTFPVGESHCSFIVGGWGGGVVGISSIDGLDASENDTTKYMSFDKDKWYRIRVRVTPAKLEAWIDDERVVDQSIEGRRISMRPGEIEIAKPLAISTYQTSSALRNLKLRRLPGS